MKSLFWGDKECRQKKRKKRRRKIVRIIIGGWEKFKNHWITWIASFLLLFLLLAIILFPGNNAHNTFLEYLSIVISWPLVLLIILLVFFYKFEGQIARVIRYGFGFKRGDWGVFFPGEQSVLGYTEMPKIKDELKVEIRKSDQKVKTILKESDEEKRNLLLFLGFERFIRGMYRSQYNLLRWLNFMGSLTTNYCHDVFYYQQYLKEFRGRKDYRFQSYLSWLINQALFIKKELKDDIEYLKITPLGITFLAYCNQMGYNELTFPPF